MEHMNGTEPVWLDDHMLLQDRELLQTILRFLRKGLVSQSFQTRLKALFFQRSANFRQDLFYELKYEFSRYLDPDMLNDILQYDEITQPLLIFLMKRPGWIETEVLRRMLGQRAPTLRARALLVAGQKGDLRLFTTIAGLLSDSSMVVDTEVQGRNFHFYPMQVISGTQVPIQELAFEIMKTLDAQRAFSLLHDLLQNSEGRFRIYLLDQLLRPEAPLVAHEILVPLLDHSETHVRIRALKLCERLRQSEQIPPAEPFTPVETWLAFLQDSDAKLRRLALLELDQYKQTPINCELIVPFCDDSDPEIVNLARQIVERQRSRGKLSDLQKTIEQIQEKPHLIGEYQNKGLPTGLYWDDIYSGLINALLNTTTKNPYDDYQVIEWLLRIRGHKSMPDLLKLFQKRPIFYRHFTQIALSEDIPYFVSFVEKASTPHHLVVGIHLLRYLKATQHAALVLPHLQHPDPEVKQAVINYIVALESPEERIRLLPLLTDQATSESVYNALKATPIPAAFESLIEMIMQGSPEWQFNAIRLAGYWCIQAAVPLLQEILLSNQSVASHLSYASAEALSKIGDPQALPALRQYLSREFSFAAVEALHSLGDPETARQALLAFFKTATSDGRADALDLIQELKDPFFVPFLFNHLTSQESGMMLRRGVRAADNYIVGDIAYLILYETAEPEHMPALISLIPDMPSDRIEDIEEILDGIGERHLVWSPEVWEQISQLMTHSHEAVRELAKRVFKKMDSQVESP